MALVPLKQTITITKAGALDGWARPIFDEEVTLSARVVEETRTVTNRNGEEAVTQLRITLDKLADISYDDTINYTSEIGVTVSRNPLRIDIKRGLGGKALLTEVFV